MTFLVDTSKLKTEALLSFMQHDSLYATLFGFPTSKKIFCALSDWGEERENGKPTN